MAGIADAYAETGDESLRALLGRIWDDITQRKMYVTGGIGSRWDNEAFGADYELPARAYAETCAAIGSIMWNARMLAIEPDAKYADLIERTLFNGFLAGLSLSGHEYYYQNPLADDGTHRRQAWFGCACCPPNVVRLLAQLPGYFYAVDTAGVYVNLYADNQAELTLPGGQSVSLIQKTDYPWDGRVRITVESAGSFALRLRIPAWAREAKITVNSEDGYRVSGVGGREEENIADSVPSLHDTRYPTPNTLSSGYAVIDRTWAAGDVVELTLPMPVRRVVANPRAGELAGRVALTRGPLVYCFEQIDNTADVREILIPATAEFTARFVPDLLGGVAVVEGQAVVERTPAWDHALYRDADDVPTAARETVPVTAIPYFAWANREPGAMTVWALA
jgi:DUF1680 family protein